MTTKPKTESRRRAKAIATAVEIWCPNDGCGLGDPIPARDGSFMWTELPESVTCPECGGTFRLSTKIQF